MYLFLNAFCIILRRSLHLLFVTNKIKKSMCYYSPDSIRFRDISHQMLKSIKKYVFLWFNLKKTRAKNVSWLARAWIIIFNSCCIIIYQYPNTSWFSDFSQLSIHRIIFQKGSFSSSSVLFSKIVFSKFLAILKFIATTYIFLCAKMFVGMWATYD